MCVIPWHALRRGTKRRPHFRNTPTEYVHMPPLQIDPLIALAVVLATGATDAIYVMFTNSVLKRRRFPAATWSSIWYLLSSFAVIKYTNDWTYVFFAAFGSFVGAYLTLTFLRPAASHQPGGRQGCPGGRPREVHPKSSRDSS